MSGKIDSDDDVLAALARAHRVAPEVSGIDPRARRERERRHALRPDDGRRKRATGRTSQFNVKMKPDLKRRIVEASRAHDKHIAVLAEQAFEALLAKLEKSGRDA